MFFNLQYCSIKWRCVTKTILFDITTDLKCQDIFYDNNDLITLMYGNIVFGLEEYPVSN